MSAVSIVATAPSPSLSAIAGSSADGGPSPLLIFLLVGGAVWLLSFLVGSEPTVVVVQRTGGFLWGLALIATALAVLYLAYVSPDSFSG